MLPGSIWRPTRRTDPTHQRTASRVRGDLCRFPVPLASATCLFRSARSFSGERRFPRVSRCAFLRRQTEKTAETTGRMPPSGFGFSGGALADESGHRGERSLRVDRRQATGTANDARGLNAGEFDRSHHRGSGQPRARQIGYRLVVPHPRILGTRNHRDPNKALDRKLVVRDHERGSPLLRETVAVREGHDDNIAGAIRSRFRGRHRPLRRPRLPIPKKLRRDRPLRAPHPSRCAHHLRQ